MKDGESFCEGPPRATPSKSRSNDSHYDTVKNIFCELNAHLQLLQVRTPISLWENWKLTDLCHDTHNQSGYIRPFSHGSLLQPSSALVIPNLLRLSCTPWPLNVWMDACEAHPPRHPEAELGQWLILFVRETACRANSQWLIITTKKYLSNKIPTSTVSTRYYCVCHWKSTDMSCVIPIHPQTLHYNFPVLPWLLLINLPE